MDIIIQTSSFDATTGVLMIGNARYDCTLGKNGVTLDKREGDGKTPIGTYPLRKLLYRADRMPELQTGIPVEPLTPQTGWCEDPSHADYNKQVLLPHDSVHDKMTRDDHLYDLAVVIGYNDDPVKPGKGSAIFMHLAREEMTPTAGCIGLAMENMLVVLSMIDSDTHITILPPRG